MIARSCRGRSGITLTEILIAILIMGIGLVSLATLFPLGLIRLRDAARFQRGSLLAQSATDDIDARSLFLKSSFSQTWYGFQDPFTMDTLAPGSKNLLTANGFVPGLPVCYDPLWRAVTGIVPNVGLYDPTLDSNRAYWVGAAEARFGAGFVVDNTGALQNAFGLQDTAASAHGLQRITNFIPWSGTTVVGNQPKASYLFPFTYHNNGWAGIQASDVAADVFTSVNDIVFNSPEGGIAAASPLLPDMTLSGGAGPTNDWKYTWFFTGRQDDAGNGTMFQGDVVICDSRQFVYSPLATVPTASVPIGETVVEAIFGYSANISSATSLAVGADRTVMLRWPTSIPDPTIRIGGWIADVTYERDAVVSATRTLATQTPFQRCFWYQVLKRTDAQPDPSNGGYRRVVLTINTPVRAKTSIKLDASGNPVAIPGFTNVALVLNSVINVFPRVFTIH